MYRSDVVGSLLRPEYLKEARQRHESGEITAAEFKPIEDHAVDEAIALQERAGIDVITDGEVRRYAFYGHLVDALEGFDKLGGWAIPFRDEQGEELILQRPVVVSRLRRKRHLCAEEFTYLRARTTHQAKTTLISAQQAAAYYDSEKSSAAYATIDAYLADLVDILRGEVEELIRWAVHTSRLIPRNIRRCWIRTFVKAIENVATIRIGCWIFRSRWTMPCLVITIRALPSACTCAAETIRASSTLAETMAQSPKFSATQTSSASYLNMTMNALAVSSHSARCPTTAASYWD